MASPRRQKRDTAAVDVPLKLYYDHDDHTVVRYFIQAPVLDPRDMDILFQGGDGPEAERVLRLADAEAERLLDAAHKQVEVRRGGHKRGRDTDPDDDDEDEGAARGAHRRRVTTTIDAHRDAAASAQPAEERLAALFDEDYYYWLFAYDAPPADDFLPMGPADEDDCTVYGELGVMPSDHQEDEVPLGEKEEEQIASDMRHPAEDDDDYLVYSQCYATALYQGMMLDEKGEQFASGQEDFLPVDLTEDGSDDMVYGQDFDYKLLRPALDRCSLEVAEDATDQIDMTRYRLTPS